MAQDTTELGTEDQGPSRDPLVPVLVLVWSEEEPHRLGEVVLPIRGVGVLGRGNDAPSEGTRLGLVRQRPGDTRPTGSLDARRLSREQLRITRDRATLRVERLGRLPVEVAGVAHDSVVLRDGDALCCGRMVWRCELRPHTLPPLPPGVHTGRHRFGEPDEHGIIGESPAAWALRGQLADVARYAGHVLIQGPSGAGKESAARAIHARSDRHEGPFASRSAATLPEGLVDAELFGHAANYPNPGMPARPGLVGEADGGTLFLDELGELPEALQARLLRLLDEGEYQILGQPGRQTADLRLIAATNREEAALKHDLLHRFRFRITIPGLDARRADVGLLLRHLYRRAAASGGVAERYGDPPRVEPAFVEGLLAHPFTGHVRELDRLLWRAITEGTTGRLDLSEVRAGTDQPVRDDDPEVAEIRAALEACDGNKTQAARALGLSSRYVLLRLLKRHGLSG